MENRDKELWYDMTLLKDNREKYIQYIITYKYQGVFIDDTCADMISMFPSNIKIIWKLNNKTMKYDEVMKKSESKEVIFATSDLSQMDTLKNKKYETCFMIKVTNKQTMEEAIKFSKNNKYVLVDFEDSTNIPLELIVAFSQQNLSKIFKRVTTAEDGWVATMTMEEGSYGVLLSSSNMEDIRKLSEYIYGNQYCNTKLEKLIVNRIEHIGMGERVCIDTISKLKPNEGMLIGSTSGGGILVSSENHFLPYMDLRPFRVNAGAIHSYIFCNDNTTKYLSELKAGDKVLVVDTSGKSRAVSIGRIKMERRPMLLIECMGPDKQLVNVVVQDDWHIRLLLESNKVANATELKEGDALLGITCKPGRHLGVEISETIVER